MTAMLKRLVVVGLTVALALSACTGRQSPRPPGGDHSLPVPPSTGRHRALPAPSAGGDRALPASPSTGPAGVTPVPPPPDERVSGPSVPPTTAQRRTRPPAPEDGGDPPRITSSTTRPTDPGSVPPATLPPDPAGLPPRFTWWKPASGLSWQWQLTDAVDSTVDVPVYDVDLFDVDAGVVESLHAAGRRVICYVSAGTYEEWRPDAWRFPDSVLGKKNGWAGERWLDIRRLDVLGPIMESRLDQCRSKGFDAVEPDNVDGYTEDTGFPLRPDDQLRFNRFIADAAHARGLAVGLKNDLAQVAQLLDWFDFAVNEECARYRECRSLLPFVHAGKAVFHVEYDLDVSEFCAEARDLGLSSMRKRPDLDSWRQPC